MVQSTVGSTIASLIGNLAGQEDLELQRAGSRLANLQRMEAIEGAKVQREAAGVALEAAQRQQRAQQRGEGLADVASLIGVTEGGLPIYEDGLIDALIEGGGDLLSIVYGPNIAAAMGAEGTRRVVGLKRVMGPYEGSPVQYQLTVENDDTNTTGPLSPLRTADRSIDPPLVFSQEELVGLANRQLRRDFAAGSFNNALLRNMLGSKAAMFALDARNADADYQRLLLEQITLENAIDNGVSPDVGTGLVAQLGNDDLPDEAVRELGATFGVPGAMEYTDGTPSQPSIGGGVNLDAPSGGVDAPSGGFDALGAALAAGQNNLGTSTQERISQLVAETDALRSRIEEADGRERSGLIRELVEKQREIGDIYNRERLAEINARLEEIDNLPRRMRRQDRDIAAERQELLEERDTLRLAGPLQITAEPSFMGRFGPQYKYEDIPPLPDYIRNPEPERVLDTVTAVGSNVPTPQEVIGPRPAGLPPAAPVPLNFRKLYLLK